MSRLRDRIKEFRRIKASELKANPRNWRTHPSEQRSAFRGLLREVGIAGAVIAYESAGGLLLIDGHMRLEEIGESGDVPVLILDVTEAEAEKLLVAIDPIAGMATTDEGKLQLLLAEIETQDDDFAELWHLWQSKSAMLSWSQSKHNHRQKWLGRSLAFRQFVTETSRRPSSKSPRSKELFAKRR